MPIFASYTLSRGIPGAGQFFINGIDGGVSYSIPVTLENRDCAQFLQDWIAGVPVFATDGVTPYLYDMPNRLALGLPP